MKTEIFFIEVSIHATIVIYSIENRNSIVYNMDFILLY